MFFNFNMSEDIEEFIIEVKLGNQISKQKITAPLEIVKMQFIQMCQEAANSEQPLKIKFKQDVPVYNQFRDNWKTIENSVQFANKAYMNAFSEEFKKE